MAAFGYIVAGACIAIALLFLLIARRGTRNGKVLWASLGTAAFCLVEPTYGLYVLGAWFLVFVVYVIRGILFSPWHW